MLQGEHSAILLTFIKLPFVLSIFEWPLQTGFTVLLAYQALGTMNPGSVSLGPLGTFMSVTNMGEKNTPIHSS